MTSNQNSASNGASSSGANQNSSIRPNANANAGITSTLYNNNNQNIRWAFTQTDEKWCNNGNCLQVLNAIIAALLRGGKIKTHQQQTTQIEPHQPASTNTTTTIEIENSNGNESSVQTFTLTEINTKANGNKCKHNASRVSEKGANTVSEQTNNTEASANGNSHQAIESSNSGSTNQQARVNNSASSSSNEKFICKDRGIFADPRDCSKFYMCGADGLHHFSCPNTLQFDSVNKVCNWPQNVKCNLR